jgi:hypothetical protein
VFEVLVTCHAVTKCNVPDDCESFQQLLRINALYYIFWSPELCIVSEGLVVFQ